MRMLHTMLRVRDLDVSIRFYTEVLGMKLLRRQDYPSGEFTLAFVGYGDETDHTVLELTHNWGDHTYDIGTGYGHIAIEVPDVYASADAIKAKGGKILREAGPMNAGSTIIAFVADPDGYPIELIGEK
ncbi:MAG: lactoylglutathione lyase [Halothiobacillus sp. 14-55-98]|nr:MAG: lactoylglutathione lyase [Halothiobacillus sp. 14-55-98]